MWVTLCGHYFVYFLLDIWYIMLQLITSGSCMAWRVNSCMAWRAWRVSSCMAWRAWRVSSCMAWRAWRVNSKANLTSTFLISYNNILKVYMKYASGYKVMKRSDIQYVLFTLSLHTIIIPHTQWTRGTDMSRHRQHSINKVTARQTSVTVLHECASSGKSLNTLNPLWDSVH